MKHFFNLSEVLPRLQHLKNKSVVTVCTGGVRCEKASGFLIQNGFREVFQLRDGIQSYLEKYPNQHFKGKLYVFDNRITVGFNTDGIDNEIVGRCFHCSTFCDTYVNCEFDDCHRHYICCSACKDDETRLAFCNRYCKKGYLESERRKAGKKKKQQFRVKPQLSAV